MIAEIQRLLSRIYDVDLDSDVRDFLCDREEAMAVVGDEVDRGEVLLVLEEEEDISVGLYIQKQALESLKNLESAAVCPEGFPAFSLATEGVSHWLYLLFRAHHEGAVSALELELQAEVDKYAAGLLAGNGAGAIRQRSRRLRRRILRGVEFLDGADTPEGSRYREAHQLAARYIAWLEREYVDTGRLPELFAELRRYYRLSRREKAERASR